MSSSQITFRYAKSDNDGPVSIEMVAETGRHAFGVLRCFGCDRTLVAALGQKTAHHFRHKHEPENGSCGFETYLHSMTKSRIHAAIVAMRTQGDRLWLYRPNTQGTRTLDHHGRLVKEDLRHMTHDLLDGALDVTLEKKISGFIPDVGILRSGRDPVYVEVAVTHFCEKKKIETKYPIIEFEVDSEVDSDRICAMIEHGVIRHERGVILHNFPILIETTSLPRPEIPEPLPPVISIAAQPVAVSAPRENRYQALLTRSGKILISNSPGSLSRYWGSALYSADITAALSYRPLKIIDAFAHHARFEKKLWVKSCLLCKYHGLKMGLGEAPMTCMRFGGNKAHTAAVDCKSFYPLADLKSLQQHRINLDRKGKPRYSQGMIPPDAGWDLSA